MIRLFFKLFMFSLLLPTSPIRSQVIDSYNLSLGDNFVLVSETVQVFEQTVSGEKYTTIQKTSARDKFEVVAIFDGGYRLLSTIMFRRLSSDSPLELFIIDSNKEGIQHLPLRSMVAKSFYVDINSKGRVLKLDQLDQLVRDVKFELSEKFSEEVIDGYLNAFNSDVIISILEDRLRIYQEDGEEWSVSSKRTINSFPVELEAKFVRKNYKTIQSQGQISLVSEANYKSNKIVSKLEGSHLTTYTLQLPSGLPSKIVSKQNLVGSILIQGLSVPTKISSEIFVELIDN